MGRRLKSCETTRAATPLRPAQFGAAIAAALMTILLAALDQTIVGVAVPTIARELGGLEWMAWVVSGYLVAATATTPLCGRLSDIYGRRRVTSVAIALFVLASAGCALSLTLPQLVLARVLQGAAGGGLIAMAQSVIADVAPVRDHGRYQGMVSIVWAVASLLGPVAGGLLTEYLSWPWIFWINVPVGALALLFVQRSLHGLPTSSLRPRVDWTGALLLLGGMAVLLIAITRVGHGEALASATSVATWMLAIVLLAAFVAQQRRAAEGILPLALFRMRGVTTSALLLFICFFNFIALTLLVPLRLQLVAGMNTSDAALGLLPLTAAVPAAAFLAGHWSHRTGRVLPQVRLGVALVPFCLALLGFATPAGLLAMIALVLVGCGMGLQMPTTLITAQQSVPSAHIGTVTALTAFFRLLGGAVGIAVLSALTLAWLRAGVPADLPAHVGAQSTGPLFDFARPESSAGGVDDAAFRNVMYCGAAVAMVSCWLVARLPDVRLHT